MQSTTNTQSLSRPSLPVIAPLVIRKKSSAAPGSPPSNRDGAQSSPPIRTLLSRPELSKGRLPKLKIALGDDDHPEGRFGGGSYIGPPPEAVYNDDQDSTVRPSSGSSSKRESLHTLRQTVSEISHHRSDSSDRPLPIAAGEVTPSSNWSDEVLQELFSLGEGASGIVHAVRDTQTRVVMARKTITTREAPMKQILRELNVITKTAHPNIVKFYGAYISPSSSEVKVLMEYCEGGSLEAIGKKIKERKARVAEKVVGKFAEGVMEGLAYLHSQKIIHRDIKPSNILLSKDGIVKLCDFGVSGELVDSRVSTFTGTSYYMAPERIHGDAYGIRADVWSTGMSLLELAQNRFPLPTEDLLPIDLIVIITKGEPPQLQDEPDIQWTDMMKDFIRVTLTVSASARPTPEEMLQHPWMVRSKQQKVDMALWIRQVWDWPELGKP